MNIKLLSTQYEVRKIGNKDISDVLNLCQGNPTYYQFCPPAVSMEGIESDRMALPPNKTPEDKFYIGFYKNNGLVAVMDLITRFPNDETAFIGFFMVKKELQGTGLGTKIITQVLQCLKSIGYAKVRLGYVKNNPQPRIFWEKNLFKPTGVEDVQAYYTVVLLEKIL